MWARGWFLKRFHFNHLFLTFTTVSEIFQPFSLTCYPKISHFSLRHKFTLVTYATYISVPNYVKLMGEKRKKNPALWLILCIVSLPSFRSQGNRTEISRRNDDGLHPNLMLCLSHIIEEEEKLRATAAITSSREEVEVHTGWAGQDPGAPGRGPHPQ